MIPVRSSSPTLPGAILQQTTPDTQHADSQHADSQHALAAASDYILSLDQFGPPQNSREYHFEHGIARARHLLDRLGGAPYTTTHCVLVAGSKGKGSTVAMLASVLAAAGYRTGAFVGPHLHTPLERFAIHLAARIGDTLSHPISTLGPYDQAVSGGTLQMPDAVFVDFAQRIRTCVETWDRPELGLPTRFEAFTAMAYRWFEEQGVNIAVMEIGIGGRLDAVNLADPIVSVITNISLEHTQMLGNTLGEIARAKAGIMRAGQPVAIAQQTRETMDVLCAEAAHVGAKPLWAENGWHCEALRHQIGGQASGQWFSVPQRFGSHAPLFVPLLGEFQLQNAAAALAACDGLSGIGFGINERAIREGLAHIQWRGRFEVLDLEPLVIADGAHTPYSIQQLCASLSRYFPDRHMHFIVAILRDKDARGMLQALANIAASVVFCDLPVRRATAAGQLLAHWNELPGPHVTGRHIASLYDALRHVRTIASGTDVICITGSLHLVAEAEELMKAAD